MQIVKIPKKTKGQFRTIYVPNPEEKAALRSLIPILTQKMTRTCNRDVVHGFFPRKSAVSNALAHQGHKYTLNFDLQDFFESVKEVHLKEKLPQEIIAQVLVDGAARQGLPTSPIVANIAAIDLDRAICRFMTKRKMSVIYTRYADDLAFSFDEPELIAALRSSIPQIVSKCGFKINPAKTHLMSSAIGRRIITGVSVGDTDIRPTRKVRRKLRAALHQLKLGSTDSWVANSAHGLTEWSKLKPPNERKRKVSVEDCKTDLQALCAEWSLTAPAVIEDKLSVYEEFKLKNGNTCIITGDPAYILGMSTYTNGWTSCMSHPKGTYRKGTTVWLQLQGTRVAAILHPSKTLTFAGVERPVMMARSLVHTFRNGKLAYDRIYGNPVEVDALAEALSGIGILPISKFARLYPGEKVVGHTTRPKGGARPYLDSLKVSKGKLKESKKSVWIYHV